MFPVFITFPNYYINLCTICITFADINKTGQHKDLLTKPKTNGFIGFKIYNVCLYLIPIQVFDFVSMAWC